MRLGSIIVLASLSVCVAAAQGIDLSSLDKLAKSAREVNEVSLDGDNLSTASRFLYGDDPDIKEAKKIIEGIRGIWVRNYSFKGKNAYGSDNLSPIRKQFQGNWSKAMESKNHNDDGQEIIQVYLRTENQQTSGLAVIAEEPRELTVVVILGTIDLERLGRLSGNLGIPKLDQLKHKKRDGE